MSSTSQSSSPSRSQIVAGTNDGAYDVNGDNAVDLADQEQWLSDAATQNGFAGPYLKGDANLDGTVNSADLNAVGINWQASVDTWSQGDFDASGLVNANDLNLMAINWQDTVPVAAADAQAVPEGGRPLQRIVSFEKKICLVITALRHLGPIRAKCKKIRQRSRRSRVVPSRQAGTTAALPPFDAKIWRSVRRSGALPRQGSGDDTTGRSSLGLRPC